MVGLGISAWCPLPWALLTLQGPGTSCTGFSPLLCALSWMLEWQVAGSGLLGVLSLFCLLFSILKLVLPLNYWLCALQHGVKYGISLRVVQIKVLILAMSNDKPQLVRKGPDVLL